jgi:hypothetical protein
VFVDVRRSRDVASFFTVTFAPGTTAPDESRTVPESEVVSDWPSSTLGVAIRTANITAQTARTFQTLGMNILQRL